MNMHRLFFSFLSVHSLFLCPRQEHWYTVVQPVLEYVTLSSEVTLLYVFVFLFILFILLLLWSYWALVNRARVTRGLNICVLPSPSNAIATHPRTSKWGVFHSNETLAARIRPLELCLNCTTAGIASPASLCMCCDISVLYKLPLARVTLHRRSHCR